MNLAHLRILLGVTGGIAAYKSADLVRRLREVGAEVRVVMTESAQEFITPLTMQAVSGQPVYHDLLDARAEAAMGHIELARWANLVLIAPASANFIARLAHGMADDLLTTLCLATTAKLVIAPAMNQQMWQNLATQANCQLLRQRHITILGPAAGAQACGEVGFGRMLEPMDIVRELAKLNENPPLLAKQKIMITAGPTQEAVDPVRYITNHSSGKMGYALAEAAIQLGAEVLLISGPTQLTPPAQAELISVTTAQEMYEAAIANAQHCKIFIGAAAVADYRCEKMQTDKIKKHADKIILELIRNPDIIAAIANLPNKPFVVGFAAETRDLHVTAQAKLAAKKLDVIAANWVNDGQGFYHDKNALHVYWNSGEKILPEASKQVLAQQLMELIAELYLTNT